MVVGKVTLARERIIMRTAAALVAVASFEVLSLVRGEDTITVFRNTLDRAASGVRGGATLVRASGAATAPVRLIIQQNSQVPSFVV